MDKFKEVNALILVADLGSLAKAAIQEDVTPVVIGRRLDSLERRLGVKLLHRSTRSIKFTDVGISYLDECRKMIKEWDLIEESISQGPRVVTGHLNVTAPAAFGRIHISPHAQSFLEKHPNLRISFNFTDKVIDFVQEGYDLSIRIGGNIDNHLIASHLGNNKRVVCASPDYLKKHGTPNHPKDLLHHQCLVLNYRDTSMSTWHFQENGKPFQIRPHGLLDCNDGEILKKWAIAGYGFVWRSTWEVNQEIQEGKLITVLDEFSISGYNIMALYSQQRIIPAKIKLFVQHLKSCFSTNIPDV
jgi:DNA-binding transcriptional LysR family regulator